MLYDVCVCFVGTHTTPPPIVIIRLREHLTPCTCHENGQVHELYERVNEVLRLAGDAVPLRAGMAVERQLAIAAEGSTLEPSEIAAVASALEGLFELREFFCGVKADAKVGWGSNQHSVVIWMDGGRERKKRREGLRRIQGLQLLTGTRYIHYSL